MSRRLLALMQRYLYLLTNSWPRFFELLYWPTLNMVVWGFLNFYLSKQTSGAGLVAGVLLGGAMLWDVLVRSQFGVFFPFLEELWSRNLGHIFVSPIGPIEYASTLILQSILRTAIAMTPCILLAKVFFGYWLFDLGLPMIGFFFCLAMTGWWLGLLLIALLLRHGASAEWMAWMIAFIISPFVAVYYPVSVLPEWVQTISWALPPTYVFEGMRAIVNNHEFRPDLMLNAFLLNMLYLGLSAAIYWGVFENTRRGNGLLHVNE